MSDFQAYSPVGEIRAAAILTTSYVVSEIFGDIQLGITQSPTEQAINIESTSLVLGIAFTIGSLTSASIKIEFSTDGATWFQECSETTASGVSTISAREHKLTADLTGSIAVALTHPFVRVSAIGVGTVTGSSLALDAHFIRKLS